MAAVAESDGEAGYLEKYAVYGRRFGKGERSVKRWVAFGKEKGDRCPLDDAVALKAWWTRHMKHRVPEGILREAAKESPLLELPVVKAPAPEKAAAPARPAAELGEIDRGIAQSLKRAEEREWHAHQKWLQAVEEKDEDKAAFAQRQCAAAAENVRRIQKDATEEEIRLRNYIPRLEAEQRAGEFGQDLLSRTRGLGEGFCRALGIPFTAEVEAKWSAEVDLLCESLQVEVFSREEPA